MTAETPTRAVVTLNHKLLSMKLSPPAAQTTRKHKERDPERGRQHDRRTGERTVRVPARRCCRNLIRTCHRGSLRFRPQHRSLVRCTSWVEVTPPREDLQSLPRAAGLDLLPSRRRLGQGGILRIELNRGLGTWRLEIEDDLAVG